MSKKSSSSDAPTSPSPATTPEASSSAKIFVAPLNSGSSTIARGLHVNPQASPNAQSPNGPPPGPYLHNPAVPSGEAIKQHWLRSLLPNALSYLEANPELDQALGVMVDHVCRKGIPPNLGPNWSTNQGPYFDGSGPNGQTGFPSSKRTN